MVACSSGTSNFCTELSDSPTSLRSFAAAWPSVGRTCSFPAAVTCSRASTSPFAQFRASRPIMYCVPSAAIEPARYALLPVRWHTSRAKSSRQSLIRRMRHLPQRLATFSSETMFRKGDWPKSTARACLSVSSKTSSPVELAKSASTMVSFSVSACARRGK